MRSSLFEFPFIAVVAWWGVVQAYTFPSFGRKPFHLYASLSNEETKKKTWMNKLGFRRASRDGRVARELYKSKRSKDIKHRITDRAALEDYFQDTKMQFRDDKGEIDYSALLGALDVRGDTQIIGTANYTHPVLQLLHERRRSLQDGAASVNTTTPTKVALAIEGGGMRGCVSAGAICAIYHLNLTNCIDVVYGASAGSLIGSYLITDQLPWFGPELYYDKLTTAGRQFIDTRRLLRALGFGLLDPRLLKDVLTRRAFGKPVLNLSFLLQKTMQETKPLDWDTFVAKQSTIPLKVVVSDLKSERSRALDMAGGYFQTLSELSQCMHASCLLPGIAGPLVNMDMDVIKGRKKGEKFILGNNLNADAIHPMADALVYEPLPYHSAIDEGATHVIVVRSRPDGVDVSGKSSFFESLIFRRFFLRKNRLPHIFELFRRQQHKKIYARDVLELNEHANSQQHYLDTSKPHILTIAAPPGSPEVSRLETGRQAIFEGIRRGFARAYDCLVEDPSQRGKGMEVALEFFPDDILDYDPLLIDTRDESAYEYYLKQKQI
ncbi:hypothetical protein FisN_21Hh150 [Fistulifera solaris]|uniref:PNPLA domain-containing protein n=1 Tax=Fistulifera solaris TaxID=1519565 RepID=A0A1Z5JRY0_FISSO|nr:hypothetical protein FisN_21Hh150 [Fistulifera solaris]|eukprot:GAX16709.1 hypothetical protein FisN_21Hh150 [Fistulifera solaris]